MGKHTTQLHQGIGRTPAETAGVIFLGTIFLEVKIKIAEVKILLQESLSPPYAFRDERDGVAPVVDFAQDGV